MHTAPWLHGDKNDLFDLESHFPWVITITFMYATAMLTACTTLHDGPSESGDAWTRQPTASRHVRIHGPPELHLVLQIVSSSCDAVWNSPYVGEFLLC